MDEESFDDFERRPRREGTGDALPDAGGDGDESEQEGVSDAGDGSDQENASDDGASDNGVRRGTIQRENEGEGDIGNDGSRRRGVDAFRGLLFVLASCRPDVMSPKDRKALVDEAAAALKSEGRLRQEIANWKGASRRNKPVCLIRRSTCRQLFVDGFSLWLTFRLTFRALFVSVQIPGARHCTRIDASCHSLRCACPYLVRMLRAIQNKRLGCCRRFQNYWSRWEGSIWWSRQSKTFRDTRTRSVWLPFSPHTSTIRSRRLRMR
jgi:hypothetical protein